jgi:acyl dehydratase
MSSAAPSTGPGFPATISLDCPAVNALDLALYAAASGDHNPLHLDAAVAQAAGFDRPVVQGMLTMAYAGRLFTRHFGTEGLMSLNTRFVGVALKGDRIALEGQLQSQDDTGAVPTATYTVTARTDRGTDVVTGTAQVRRPRGESA